MNSNEREFLMAAEKIGEIVKDEMPDFERATQDLMIEMAPLLGELLGGDSKASERFRATTLANMKLQLRAARAMIGLAKRYQDCPEIAHDLIASMAEREIRDTAARVAEFEKTLELA